MLRHTIAGSVVLALASMTAGRAGAEDGPQLTSDQQSLVLLAVRAKLTSHPDGWTSKTPLCLRVGVFAEETHRPAQAPPKLLRQLNGRGYKVVAADECVTRVSTDANGNDTTHFRDANQRPADLLEVEIHKMRDHSLIDVSLADVECAPLSCQASDVYTATKTKRGWTIDYEGKVLD